MKVNFLSVSVMKEKNDTSFYIYFDLLIVYFDLGVFLGGVLSQQIYYKFYIIFSSEIRKEYNFTSIDHSLYVKVGNKSVTTTIITVILIDIEQ